MEDGVAVDRRKVFGVAALVTAGVAAITANAQTNDQTTTTPNKKPADATTTAAPAAIRAASVPDRQPGSSGEKPFVRDEANWQKVVASLSAIYDPTKPFPRIEDGFSYKPRLGDDEFRLQHVESLLDQAADLLDRGLKGRSEWNSLNDKRFTLFLSLKEYTDLDKIHQEEAQKGFYTVAYKQSTSSEEAESWITSYTSAAASYLTSLLADKFSLNEKNRQSAQAQLQAWLAHLAVYQLPNVGNPLPCTFDGVAKTAPEHMKDSEFIQSFYRMETEEGLVRSSESSQLGNAQASRSRLKGATAKADWDFVDVDFRRRRTQVARDMADLKTIAFTAAGGALNYSEQMLNVQIRFHRDLNDAVARISAAYTGMSTLYGYDVKPPSDPSVATYFDDLLVWVRDAISRLIRFTLVDQNYVMPLPLSNLVPEAQLAKGLTQGRWEVEIGPGTFATQTNVRLRGVSAVVVLKDEDDQRDRRSLWLVRLVAPREASMRLKDGKTETINQKSIPPVQLGRVSHYESTRDPDVVGIAALHNVSPIGKWIVEIDKRSTSGSGLDRLKDLVINLHLAVRFAQ